MKKPKTLLDVTLSDFVGCSRISRGAKGMATVIVNVKNQVIKVKDIPYQGKTDFEIIEYAYRDWLDRDDDIASQKSMTH